MIRSNPIATTLLLWQWHNLLAAALGTSFTKPSRHIGPDTDVTRGDSPRLLEPPGQVVNGTLGLLSDDSQSVRQGSDPIGNILKDITKALHRVGDETSGVSGSVSDVAGDVSQVAGGVADIVGILGRIVDAVRGNDGNGSSHSVADRIRDIAQRISNISGTVSDVSGTVSNISGQVTGVVDQVLSHTTPIQQGGHSVVYINHVVCILVGLVCVVVAGLYILERGFQRFAPAEGRPRLWLLGMLLTSYGMLIPGLCQVLFSFVIGIELVGLHITITTSPNDGKPAAITETMISVVQTLYRTGSLFGAILVIMYAMVIPALKLLLLLVGECWRFSEHAVRVATARWCIRIVQMISKWACPDMFAYILLLYLLRALDHRSSLIEAPAHLDDGFSCFSIFCVCSTFSSLAIPLPNRPRSEVEAVETTAAEPETSPATEESEGERKLQWGVGMLFLLFSVLFSLGLILPCMAMRLEPSLLVEPRGPLPQAVLPLIDALNLESQVNSEVSMWHCVFQLVQWLYYGEANCILALVMLGLFALVLPVLNMVVLVFAVESTTVQVEHNSEEKPRAWCRGTMKIAQVIKHISMLDVAVMGVLIVCLAGQSYRSQGILFMLRPGLLFLFLAEVIHYVTYYWVQSVIKNLKHTAAGDY